MRVVLSGLVAFVTMFGLGAVWNVALMSGFYAANAPANARAPEDQSMLGLLLGYFLLAAFMTFLFSQSFQNRPGLAEGFQFGALFGVIATLPIYLILYSVWDFPLKWALVDSGWHLVEQGAGGIVLALTAFPKARAARQASS